MKPKLDARNIAIDKIAIRDQLRTRVEVSRERVEHYKIAMENGAKFPRIDIYQDRETGQWVLLSGEHRLLAHQALGRDKIDVYIHWQIKSDADAIELATIKNSEHGLPFSTKDKRNTIEKWLIHKRLWDKSDRTIARVVGCDHKTVAAVRAEFEQLGKFPNTTKRTGADGKLYNASKPKVEKPKSATTTPDNDVPWTASTATIARDKSADIDSSFAPVKVNTIATNNTVEPIDTAAEDQVDEVAEVVEHDQVDDVAEDQHDLGDDQGEDADEDQDGFNLADKIVSLKAAVRIKLRDWPQDHLARAAQVLRELADTLDMAEVASHA